MAKAPPAGSLPDGVVLSLTPEERALLDGLRDGISERMALRHARGTNPNRGRQDSKRARLARSQEQLEETLDVALTSPGLARAMVEAGYEAEALRDFGARGTWVRNVIPAIDAVRPPEEREREVHRQEAIDAATQAIAERNAEQGPNAENRWLHDLEGRVRASLDPGQRGADHVAPRLIEWMEEAIAAVPKPAAAATRAMLASHGVALGGENAGDELLRAVLRLRAEEDMSAPVGPRVSEDEGRAARMPDDPGQNRISAGDDEGVPQGERQIGDLVDAGSRADEIKAAPGILSRVRDYLGERRAVAAEARQAAGGADSLDELPDTLKRRYAIHVSDDRKTIQLFEAGEKTAAITLDARSISTPHDEGTVIADMIALARDRGWQSIKAAGTADFKDAIWLEAAKAGLVAQHEPTPATRAAFTKWENERPANQILQGLPDRAHEQGSSPAAQVAQAFASKNFEERLTDPRLRNAQLELMIGIRTAEKELKRPIAEMPDVAQALTAAVREQLANGKVFVAPFVRADQRKVLPRQVSNPKIDADRIPPPRR